MSCSKFRPFILLLSLTLAYLPALSQQENLVEHKGELEKIRQEIEQSKRNIDSLQAVEKRLQKELLNYEQRTSINETVLKRLTSQLETTRKNVRNAKTELEQSQSKYQITRSRYIENLAVYYKGMQENFLQPEGAIELEEDAFRRYLYLKAFAGYDRARLSRASEFLKEAESEYAALMDKEKTIGSAQRRKKQEYTLAATQKERRERDLSRLKRKRDAEADRLLSLSEAARQMEELISRLESERQERERSEIATDFDFTTGNFVSYKGRLIAPMSGKVVKGFGWSTHPVTKLKSYSPGIELKGEANKPVVAVADGVVAYVGNLRGYGIFVIIEHEDGYYSTYAGLKNVSAESRQLVRRGERLGLSENGLLKFELRQGKEPVDPVEWIRIDYLK
ncbi:MAG: peptidoglycan DD-metalloendopeptidase family protein [Candidatus Zixiibacteriota bacterium]